MAKANAGEQQTGSGTTRTARKSAGANKGAADGAGKADGQGSAQADGGARKSAVKSAGANGTTPAKRASASRPAADTSPAASQAPSRAAKASNGTSAAAGTAAPASSARAGAASARSSGAQATKAPARKSAGAAKPAAGGAPAGGARGGKPNLAADLREFVTARPNGWGHADWTGFLDHLTSRGHDTSNPDDIGMQLERERLSSKLAGLGLTGPRVKKVVDRFGTLWSLRHADAAELEAAGLTSAQVDEVARAMRD